MYDEPMDEVYFSSDHIRRSKTPTSRLKSGWLHRYQQFPKRARLWLVVGVALLLILAFGSAYGLFFRAATPRTPAVSNMGIVPRAPGSASPTVESQETPFPALSQVGKEIPTPTPVVQPTPQRGVNNNPWGYNFEPGQLIYNPPAQFCFYFKCVQDFYSQWAHGYVVECNDSSFSRNGGTQYACARDYGVKRKLYAH